MLFLNYKRKSETENASSTQAEQSLPDIEGSTFFLINIALLLHIIPMPRFTVVADRYIYLPCIGLAFIVAYYFTEVITSKKGIIRNLVIGGFTGFLLYFCIYSNLRSREWKDTDSIKKELRELVKSRKDYVPDKAENLLENEPETH